MRPFVVLGPVVLFAASALAESVLDYTRLPQCARQCPVLAQAEGGCVPPAAPVTNQAIYQSCVCQSALLTGLKVSGAQCQPTGCSADDAAKITEYYNALCSGPVVVPAPTTTLATSTTSSTSTSTAAAGANAPVPVKNKTWLERTYPWVIFACVTFAGALIIIALAVWWKRRHARKVDARKANMAADPAPYKPPPSASSRSRSGTGILKRSSSRLASSNHVNGPPPTPPMTALSGPSMTPHGRAIDTGVGAIAPPRQPNKLRSRSSTLQSLGLGNGSKANVSEPVVWGPHQHAAHHNAGHAGNMVPPTPPPAIASPPPHPVYRTREFGASEPHFTSLNPGRVRTPMAEPGGDRPYTAGVVDRRSGTPV